MKKESLMKKIDEIAKLYEIKKFQHFGDYVAKVENEVGNKNGKLILVTAMTSNKSGIGKTTISIGLADALNCLGENAILALREPSMGPVFGIKGGATGGGKSSVFPSEAINLHFTGDFHAVAQANNLLVSILDNHIFQGNQLKIDTKNIFLKRCLDINDRSLREIEYKIGDKKIKSGFVITAASEVMAVLCLSENLMELKENLGNILVALDENGKPIFAHDLQAEESMTILLKEALKPNLVQTLGGTPVLVHLGPFANIAHGCNSLVATKFALSHADFCVTEAGFGSDLGAEKFLDIKCRQLGKTPDVAVLVVTLCVVKQHGEGDLEKGFENVKKHLKNLREVFGLDVVVAINKHENDDEVQLKILKSLCENEGILTYDCDAFSKGGEGCLNLAEGVVEMIDNHKDNLNNSNAKSGLKEKILNLFKKKKSEVGFNFCYDMKDDIKTKIQKIAMQIYGAKSVQFSENAQEKLALVKKLGFENFFVNIAKTQFSFSDDKNLLGAPKDFDFHITDIEIRSGAKMIVAIAGNQLLMPALGKNSNYLTVKIDDNGKIEGNL